MTGQLSGAGDLAIDQTADMKNVLVNQPHPTAWLSFFNDEG